MSEQEQNKIAINRMAGPPAAVAASGLTPKDILGIFRRHISLIVLMIILGFIAGGVSWYLLKKYYPKYTARTYIKVFPPVEKDPSGP